ncbi:GntR family transcriptional regulator [Streptomyces sp. NPDC090106]|uniref:GntR family transcriptional regulator n=1 Tax=Streptomyces sp. NPDC090106 TaxID=3365946 RepID=UPI003801763B
MPKPKPTAPEPTPQLDPAPQGSPTDVGSDLYWRLRRDVMDGRFPPESSLMETALSGQYGVSRTPMREALALLEHDGLLERAQRGFRVRSGTAEDVVEIYEARIALEAEAAASAALRATELDLARLRRQQDVVIEAASQDGGEAAARAASFRFHELLWQAGHNATITELLVKLTARLRIYDSGPPSPFGGIEPLREEHDAILGALHDHDPERAHTAVRTHLRRSLEQRINVLIQQDGGDSP